MSIDRRMDKENVVYNYSTYTIIQPLKSREFGNTTTWMDLEDIMLSEISQREEDKYYISLAYAI